MELRHIFLFQPTWCSHFSSHSACWGWYPCRELLRDGSCVCFMDLIVNVFLHIFFDCLSTWNNSKQPCSSRYVLFSSVYLTRIRPLVANVMDEILILVLAPLYWVKGIEWYKRALNPLYPVRGELLLGVCIAEDICQVSFQGSACKPLYREWEGSVRDGATAHRTSENLSSTVTHRTSPGGCHNLGF